MKTVTGEKASRALAVLRSCCLVIAAAAGILGAGLAGTARAARPEECGADGFLRAQGMNIGGAAQPDLLINVPCKVTGTAPYYYSHVNIVGPSGKLIFIEPPVEPSTVKGQDFWATSIIIEKDGALLAGVDDQKPYGANGKTLTFHLYGADPRGTNPTKIEGPGESCVPIKDKANFADCGIPLTKWDDNGKTEWKDLPGNAPPDYFYQYSNFHGDSGTSPVTGQEGHFGYKVLALSYGGTLRLRGLKGTSGTPDSAITTLLKDPDKLNGDADEKIITDSGSDWVRLAGNSGSTLTLSRNVKGDWQPGDEVVVTSTDYFPEHSELRTISGTPAANQVTLTTPLTYDHNFTRYDVAAKIGAAPTSFSEAVNKADGGKSPMLDKAETRAAVALLTRSIRIVSEGDNAGDTFKDATEGRKKPAPKQDEWAVMPNPNYQYGGQTVYRQGFAKLQLQGVEFKQLGQGGLLGRYPVHFHMARRVPADTYVIDCSVNESMTRWYVIHSTLGVTLARDVGWKSIGHGYFLEDATETDNKFYSNIGIYARSSVVSTDNPRNIPGLLDARNSPFKDTLKYHSDANYPSVFWITNGWNSFAGNMAAGAGSCGACYWYVPAGNHDMMDVPPGNNPMTPMKWSGYSAIQASTDGPGSASRAGRSPVKLFYKNYCSSAMHSLSVTDETPCTQIETGVIRPVQNLRAPDAPPQDDRPPESDMSKMYYPRYSGLRVPTVCDSKTQDCASIDCDFGNPVSCVPSVFSQYTSSFNWAGTNFSAIWLRSSYLLLDHAFLSDVQGPGVTIVTGGDYTRSNLPVGYWGLTTNSIFVGATQPKNKYAQEKGPNADCDNRGNVCLDTKSGVAFPLSNFGTGQRMYNVYDGPAYEDANAFLDIVPSPCISRTDCMYYGTLGVRKAGQNVPNVNPGAGYLPNAAIAWKQSNGFYYPPAFHSRNLFFANVDIRHYVIEPITFPGTYRTDMKEEEKQYVGSPNNSTFFGNWSDVDRQTELSDDDGSLTGFTGTVSVNEDKFFAAPVQTAECRSGVGVDASNACAGQTPPNQPTARTSPYDHITTVLYPETIDQFWDSACSNEFCNGVPIYRQYLTGVKGATAADSTREWKTWMSNDCDAQFKALQGKSRPLPPVDPYGPPPTNPPTIPADLRTQIATWQKFDKDCPSPFVRMAGMNKWQRSVLTVNNGTYFIDTTQSETFQRKTPDLAPNGPRFVNVFGKGKTYYVFFLFAKNTTKQTYQIYGGPGFGVGSVKGVRIDASTLPLPPGAVEDWSAAPWTVTPDPTRKDVVDVTVDFNKVTGIDLDPEKLNADQSYMDETCQPHTYCTKVTSGAKTTCGCDPKKLGVLGLLNPNYLNVCKNICEHWAVKDLDCPKGGCLGFQFTLSPNFEAKDQLERPAPTAYPAADWDKTVLAPTKTAPDKSANPGGCYYSPAQTPNDGKNSTCKVAD